MRTDTSHEIEGDPWESIGAFILAFWPVSLGLGLIEFLYYEGPGAIPINLAVASIAGWMAVKRHEARTSGHTEPNDALA